MANTPPKIQGLICPLCGKSPGTFYYEDDELNVFFMRCKSCNEYLKFIPEDDKWARLDHEKYKKEEEERHLKEKIESKATEAREWLKNTLETTPLAGNRFKDKEEARRFVEDLYFAGAVRVEVEDVDEPRPGYRYASTLTVIMPNLKELRDEIFTIYNEESEKETGRTESDSGQSTLTFWWD